jgi:hypothetical protein
MASALRDQKLTSANRNRGFQPIHPSATIPIATSSAPISVRTRTLSDRVESQAEATNAARPNDTAGNNNDTVQANRSFGRLTSTSRLPAIESRVRCSGLAASSSISPWRGSIVSLFHSFVGSSSPASPLFMASPLVSRHVPVTRVTLSHLRRHPHASGFDPMQHHRSYDVITEAWREMSAANRDRSLKISLNFSNMLRHADLIRRFKTSEN